MLVVILPLHAVLVPSATTWYVTLCAETIPTAEAVSPILPQWCAPTNSDTDEATVPLASNHYGPCTYKLATVHNSSLLRRTAIRTEQNANTRLTQQTERLTILRRCILPRNPLPYRLPL